MRMMNWACSFGFTGIMLFSCTSQAPFSAWQSTFRLPAKQEKPEVVEKESAEDLLRRLVEEDDPATENVRYILAVMLERKKLLRETDQQHTNTGILRIYEHRKTGEVLVIRDPDISLDQVESIQEEVTAMLESGGRAPENDGGEGADGTDGKQDEEGTDESGAEDEPPADQG